MLEKHADKNILLCLLISCSGEPMGAHDCHHFQIYPLDSDEMIDDSKDVPSVSTALVKLGARPYLAVHHHLTYHKSLAALVGLNYGNYLK